MRSRTAFPLGSIGAVLLAGITTCGCNTDESQQLEPESFAMTNDTPAFYDDGELTLYQVEVPVELPILYLQGEAGPAPKNPRITTDDVRVQVTWTLANLDTESHNVKVLIDPWNEFGRYVPGVSGEGDEAVPNLSGLEDKYEVPGTKSGRSSRVRHTVTFADMDELATDFATVINLLENVDLPSDDPEEDPRVGYVNHAFAVENRSGSDPLTDRYTPSEIPALTGFTIGLRAEGETPPNVALEFSVEIVDRDGEVVRERDSDKTLFETPETEYSLGG